MLGVKSNFQLTWTLGYYALEVGYALYGEGIRYGATLLLPGAPCSYWTSKPLPSPAVNL